jgi:hypothetical protein
VKLGELGDLGPGGGDELLVGVGVAVQAPPAGHRLGQQHPGAVSERAVARRLRDDGGEPLDDSELLAAIERARVRQHLDPDVVAGAVDVRDGAGRKLVDEGRRVGAEHGDVRDLLDLHQRGRESPGQGVLIGEGTGGAVDVDHRHDCGSASLIRCYDGHHIPMTLII